MYIYTYLKSGPSIAIPPPVKIPQLMAMALAVAKESPVTILTTTPVMYIYI
jgi:hypothetical protein